VGEREHSARETKESLLVSHRIGRCRDPSGKLKRNAWGKVRGQNTKRRRRSGVRLLQKISKGETIVGKVLQIPRSQTKGGGGELENPSRGTTKWKGWGLILTNGSSQRGGGAMGEHCFNLRHSPKIRVHPPCQTGTLRQRQVRAKVRTRVG